MRLLFCLILMSVTGCKLVVPPTAGGVVSSASGNFECLPGQECELEVTDTDFDDYFFAQPLPGYEFVGWQRGKDTLCGGSLEACHLYTSDLEGNGLFMGILQSDKVFSLVPRFRYLGDEEGASAAVFKDAESNIESVLYPEGLLLQVMAEESGGAWSRLQFVDGIELLLKTDDNGLPRELYYDDVVIRFLEYKASSVRVAVALGDDDPFATDIPLSVLAKKLAGQQSVSAQSVTPGQRSLAWRSADSAAVAEANVQAQSEASDDKVRAANAHLLAQEIYSDPSLKALFGKVTEPLKLKAIEATKSAILKLAEGDSTFELQISLMVNSGMCAVKIGSGGVISLALDASDCKAAMGDAFMLTQTWAIKRFGNLGLDRIPDDLLDPEQVELSVTSHRTTRDEAIRDYTPEIRFLEPESGSSYVSPDIKVVVNVYDSYGAINPDELRLTVDGKDTVDFGRFGNKAQKAIKRSSQEYPIEGNNYFYLKGLAAGRHTLRANLAVRGSQFAYHRLLDVSHTITVCKNGVNAQGTGCLQQSCFEKSGAVECPVEPELPKAFSGVCPADMKPGVPYPLCSKQRKDTEGRIVSEGKFRNGIREHWHLDYDYDYITCADGGPTITAQLFSEGEAYHYYYQGCGKEPYPGTVWSADEKQISSYDSQEGWLWTQRYDRRVTLSCSNDPWDELPVDYLCCWGEFGYQNDPKEWLPMEDPYEIISNPGWNFPYHRCKDGSATFVAPQYRPPFKVVVPGGRWPPVP